MLPAGSVIGPLCTPEKELYQFRKFSCTRRNLLYVGRQGAIFSSPRKKNLWVLLLERTVDSWVPDTLGLTILCTMCSSGFSFFFKTQLRGNSQRSSKGNQRKQPANFRNYKKLDSRLTLRTSAHRRVTVYSARVLWGQGLETQLTDSETNVHRIFP